VVMEVGDDIVAELLSLLMVLGEIGGSGDRPLLWSVSSLVRGRVRKLIPDPTPTEAPTPVHTGRVGCQYITVSGSGAGVNNGSRVASIVHYKKT
jgi:hypothetical protein